MIALRRYDFKPTVHSRICVQYVSLPSYRLPSLSQEEFILMLVLMKILLSRIMVDWFFTRQTKQLILESLKNARVFKCNVSGDNFIEPKIMEKRKLNKTASRGYDKTDESSFTKSLFSCFSKSWMWVFERNRQWRSLIINKYMRIRLLCYGQYFTQMTVVKTKCALRQNLNKLIYS